MKIKYEYLLPVVLALLFSCKRATVEQGAADDQEKLQIGVSLVADKPVKGLGPLDCWDARQDVYVYGIARDGKKENTNLTDLDFSNAFFIDNVRINAVPSSGEDASLPHEVDVIRKGTERYYYGEDRRYEFFGYYVDDAVLSRNDAGVPRPAVGSERIEIPIIIDGSQDILAATTDKAADNTKMLPPGRLYSAYSARKGIIPNLVFQHQLSRFNIYVKRGDRFDATHDISLADSLTLTRIQVLSNTAATLVVANRVCNDENGQSLGNGLDVNTFSSEKWLSIKCGQDLHDLSPADNIHPAQAWTEHSFVGTVMVIPGKDIYHFRLGLDQKGYTDYPRYGIDGRELYDIETEFDVDFARLLSMDQDPKYSGQDLSTSSGLDKLAMAGHQYDVNIIVYGLQEVRVTVSMTPWKDGGNHLADKDPDMGVDALNVLADDMDVYIGADYVTAVNPSVSIGDVPGMEYVYDMADETIATVDSDGYVFGHNPGKTRLLITAYRYMTNTAEEWILREDGSRILIGKGVRTISVNVSEAPLKNPSLMMKLADGTVIPNDGTLKWNIATEGKTIALTADYKGNGSVSYSISKQFVQDMAGDVLTKAGDGYFSIICDVPAGGPGFAPSARADITVSVLEDKENGYAASGDYIIHVIITNVEAQP